MYEIEGGEKKERLAEWDERFGGIGGDHRDEREREGHYGKADVRETSETDRPSGSRTRTQTGDEMV